jgi:hypothetical protein
VDHLWSKAALYPNAPVWRDHGMSAAATHGASSLQPEAEKSSQFGPAQLPHRS